MYFKLIVFSLIIPVANSAVPDVCEILKLPNCSGVTRQGRRSSSPSLPSSSTAANINPAAVSFDKGFGVDVTFQGKNPVLFGLASGTGKMGGALISSSLENSFFGNRVAEPEGALYQRELERLQYDNEKLTLALGGKLFSQRKFGLDVGLLLKYHTLINRLNPGVGVSARFWNFNFGASVYQDDFFLRIEPSSYQERFLVQTYSFGIRIKNFSLDAGTIKSHINFFGEPTDIFLYSAALHHHNFLFNLALRNEHSQTPSYLDESLQTKRIKNEIYSGVQYALNKHIIIGLNYNYFLLREFSLTTTIFF